ncbi:MAG: hypothetical protein QOE90_1443 [Thermoplasmata archaeon]|jgi:hypothetical protein|nr:hypothetical protein [Thermoplasmata archaeon]
MRTIFLLVLLATPFVFVPVAAAIPPPVQACSDLITPGGCGLNWVCISAESGAVSRCVKDPCWNTATCY